MALFLQRHFKATSSWLQKISKSNGWKWKDKAAGGTVGTRARLRPGGGDTGRAAVLETSKLRVNLPACHQTAQRTCTVFGDQVKKYYITPSGAGLFL